jgi:hypothetical protein
LTATTTTRLKFWPGPKNASWSLLRTTTATPPPNRRRPLANFEFFSLTLNLYDYFLFSFKTLYFFWINFKDLFHMTKTFTIFSFKKFTILSRRWWMVNFG